MPIFALPIAEIAQLVEHDLAKVTTLPRSGSRVRVSFSAQKVSFPLTFFYALTIALFLGLAAPFSLLWRAGEDIKKARVHVADVGSSLVFRSKGQFSTDLFLCPDRCAVPRTRGPVLPPLEGRGGCKKGACPRRRRGFESRFPLQFKPRFGGAVFVYVSGLCLACLPVPLFWLYL